MKIINKGTAQSTENNDAEDANGVGFDGCYSHVVEFDGDDAGYLEWLHAHPDGYVVNVQRDRSPDYVVLHRATCIFISRPVKQGGYTERNYVKYCAETEVDAGFAAAICGRKRGSFSRRCSHCIFLERE